MNSQERREEKNRDKDSKKKKCGCLSCKREDGKKRMTNKDKGR